ncbi:hypothetical protein tb265_07520 [Gemmatimonadetes bacterium T265]|nr:hypothetical protein tb265_07520 [Gemmatimonadetes bacterium T265]
MAAHHAQQHLVNLRFSTAVLVRVALGVGELLPHQSDLAPERDRLRGKLAAEHPVRRERRRVQAALRARRILLDERLSPPDPRYGRGLGADSLLDSLVAGMNTGLRVTESPLPSLYTRLGSQDPARFVAAAKLVAALWLRLSGTVAHVLDLDLRLTSPSRLAIHFRGQRGQQYANYGPAIITVDGECALT